jgi:hypothetical protein
MCELFVYNWQYRRKTYGKGPETQGGTIDNKPGILYDMYNWSYPIRADLFLVIKAIHWPLMRPQTHRLGLGGWNSGILIISVLFAQAKKITCAIL